MILHGKTETEIYEEALDKWGEDAQIQMVIEECSELIQALCKGYRNGLKSEYKSILEEMVDVEIMLAQLKILMQKRFRIDGVSGRLVGYKLEKIYRLKEMLEEEE